VVSEESEPYVTVRVVALPEAAPLNKDSKAVWYSII